MHRMRRHGRRHWVRLLGRVLIGLSTGLMATLAAAQAYPSKPVTIVVPWPPGAGTDAATRVIAEALGKELGQAVNVDNRAGANGAIGSAYVASGPADGYRLITATADTHSINPQLRKGLAYDAVKGFEPIALFATLSMVWVARPDLPYQTLAKTVNAARQRQQVLNVGNWGIGSTAHLAGALLEMATGLPMNQVPFQGASPAVTALGGGHIDLLPGSRLSATTLRASGKLKVLGVAAAQRAGGALADVPTLAEQGINGAEIGSWYGLMAPKGTPEDVRAKLVAAVTKVLAMPAVKDKIAATGLDPAFLAGNDFQDYLHQQYEVYGRIIRNKQISLNE